MAKRTLLAGILGGIALFAWESVSHMLTPLGDAGIQGLGNEPPVLAALKENVKAPGFYFVGGLILARLIRPVPE